MISVNKNVMPKVRYLIEHAEQLGCRHFRLESGAHIIDMGVEQKGGFEAGRTLCRNYHGRPGNLSSH